MRVDVELLLDRVALLGEIPVFPGEVVNGIEGEGLQPAVSIAEPRETVVDRGVDDAWPADESTRGDEMLIDSRDRVVPAEAFPVPVERYTPEGCGCHAMREQLIVRATSRCLEVERVEFAKHERSVDVGD